jgi:hypothetical protein
VVGYPALRGLPFTLDARRGELILHNPASFQPPPKPGGRSWRITRACRSCGRVSNDELIWLVLDSGSDGMVTLPRALLDRWPTITPPAPRRAG